MEIKVGIFLEVGSGECLLAGLIENIRCVAIFKSVDHKLWSSSGWRLS